MPTSVDSPPDLNPIVRHYSNGEFIFHEGQESDFLYSIVSGKVELLKATLDGQIHLVFLSDGETFGEMGVLENSVRSASAVAKGAVTLNLYDRDSMFAMFQAKPQATLYIVNALSQRLRKTTAAFADTEIAPALSDAPCGDKKEPRWLRRIREFFDKRERRRIRIEFQPDAVEIEHTPTPWMAAAVLYTLVAVVSVALVWSAFAQIDRVVEAEGRLTSVVPQLIVRSMETAVIRTINVREGGTVNEGDVLATLSPVIAEAKTGRNPAQAQGGSDEDEKFITLRAPGKVVVADTYKLSPGAVVRQFNPVFALAAYNPPLEFEINILAREIGLVRVGDSVRIKFEALPFQKYGTAGGIVRTINEDAVEQEQGAAKIRVYRAKVEITERNFKNISPDFRLIPGMQAKAEIRVGKRSVISFFIYPLIRTLDAGLRE